MENNRKIITSVTLPAILNIPPKLLPFIFEFNEYCLFLFDGGRGSGKTQSVARGLLFIAEKRKVRICCGRVIKESVKESVMQVFRELIEEYSLDFDISETRIVHRKTGSVIFFKGFRENEIVNVKGLQGVDILWIDEAETVTKRSLDIIIPTIRKEKSKIIFTMNRYVKNDAVYKYCIAHPNCLHIHINYFENPYCPKKLIEEAEHCKMINIADYNHIWLGLPLEQGNNYLIATEKIEQALTLSYPDEVHPNNSVMAVDLAACGGDLCVAKRLVQKSSTVWEEVSTVTWSEADTDKTKGKILYLYSAWKPDFLIGDADGLGYPIICSLKNSLENVVAFRGALQAKDIHNGNARADGYMAVKEMIEHGFLRLNCKSAARQLEYMKTKWSPQNGRTYLLSKDEIRKEQNESPDYADALMMAVYGIYYHSYFFTDNHGVSGLSPVKMNTDFDFYE